MNCKSKFFTLFVLLISSLVNLNAGTSEQYQTCQKSVEKANEVIWSHFVDKNDVLLDFVNLDGTISLPTKEEVLLGKPNALGWWTPIENGAMFGGLYMDGLIAKWNKTRNKKDASQVKRIAKGLMLLASISTVEGFVGRGVTEDGKSHYLMGSNDQTGPWFYGLWKYLQTDLPTKEERIQIEKKLISTATIICNAGWKMPAEAPFNYRGSFKNIELAGSARMLFVMKIMALMTKDEVWHQRYVKALSEKGGAENLTRLEACAKGMFNEGKFKKAWTEINGVIALRGLWEMEKDEAIKNEYRKGLEKSAEIAAESLTLISNFDPSEASVFDTDWRKMNELWQPQLTEKDAAEVAKVQLSDFQKRSPRWTKESKYVREPIFASYIVALSPNKDYVKSQTPAIMNVISYFKYDNLYNVWFFPVEAIWWRIQS